MTQSSNFPLFKKLPIELQMEIWEHTIVGPRILNFNSWAASAAANHNLLNEPWRFLSNMHLPAEAAVDSVARKSVLKDYYYLRGEGAGADYVTGNVGFRPNVDILHLPWQDYTFPTSYPEPLEAMVMRFAAMCDFWKLTPCLSDGWFFQRIEPGTLQIPTNDILCKFPQVFIILKKGCIHLPKQVAIDSGLFGRGGEENVQLLDTSDPVRILKFKQLWEAHSSERDWNLTQFFAFLEPPRPYFGSLADRFLWDIENAFVWGLYHNPQIYGEDEANVPPREELFGTYERPSLEQLINESVSGIWSTSTMLSLPAEMMAPRLDHPWVVEAKKRLPSYRPVFMLQLCDASCEVKIECPAARAIGRPSGCSCKVCPHSFSVV